MSLRAAIVDLDGTVYRGDQLVPGAPAAIRELREAGLEVLFFSNNPTRTPEEYVSKLADLDIETSPDRVLTSGVLTAEFLADRHSSESIYLIGEEGLSRQFHDVTLTDDPVEAEVVVASIDRSFTYERLTGGLRALETGAHPFIATDPDRTIPGADGTSLPGSGAIVGALSAAADRDPDYVMGKPGDFAVEAALERLDVPAESCLVIGDRLDTDIAMGGSNGMRTALVLTGAHKEWDIDRFRDTPDSVLDSIANIGNLLRSQKSP